MERYRRKKAEPKPAPPSCRLKHDLSPADPYMTIMLLKTKRLAAERSKGEEKMWSNLVKYLLMFPMPRDKEEPVKNKRAVRSGR